MTKSLRPIIISVFSILLFSGCNGRIEKTFEINFSDDANLYTEKYETKIKNKFHFPQGIPVLIKTIDSIPPNKIGYYATVESKKDSNWSFLNENIKSKNNSIFILISKHPRLIQIRYGESLTLETYNAGLSMGNKYLEIQEKFLSKNNTNGLYHTLSKIEEEFPQAISLSWFKRIVKYEVQYIWLWISDFASPSDNAYTSFIFKPLCYINKFFGIDNHIYLFVLFNAALFYLIVFITRKIILSIFGKNKITFWVIIIWESISPIFLSIPFWGIIIFLNGRTEDFLFAKHLNIPVFSIMPTSSFTPIWFTLLTGISMLIISTFKHYLTSIGLSHFSGIRKADISKEVDDHLEDIVRHAWGDAIRFSLLSLFMPFGISMLILFYHFSKLPKMILTTLKLNKLKII